MDDQFYDDDDLVTTGQPERNWKGIIIACLVITAVLACIVMSVVLLTPPDEGARVKGRRFELEDVFGNDFIPLRFNGSWISDNELIYRNQDGGVSILDVYTLTSQVLVANHTFRRFNAASFSLSSSVKYMLFTHNIQKTHRYSYTAQYTLYHIETGEATALSVDENEGPPSAESHSTLQLALWSPNGDALAFVHKGDIYYIEDVMKNEVQRITDDSVDGVVFNGIPDWLYEEEVFSSNSAMWFSPSGESLMYLHFNDTLVGEHHFIEYGSLADPHIYPRVKSLRYPKPGTNNPIVSAKIVDFQQGSATRTLIPPEGIIESDYYIVSAGWIPSTEDVCVVWTSRSYNLTIISTCEANSDQCKEVYRINMDKLGWVDNIPVPTFSQLNKSSDFITIAPIRDGENGFFSHLVYVDTVNRRSHPITHGNYDVIKIDAWDEIQKIIYYTAIPSSHPSERHLYRVKVMSPYSGHVPECLSCPPSMKDGEDVEDSEEIEGKKDMNILEVMMQEEDETTMNKRKEPMLNKESQSKNDEDNDNQDTEKDEPATSFTDTENLLGSNKSCGFVSNVKFNKRRNYFVFECSGPDIPYVDLFMLVDSKVHFVSTLQSNDLVRENSMKMAFPQQKTFPVHMSSGHSVQVRLLLPPGLREDEIIKFPLVLNVYGGPGSQMNTDRWKVDFSTYLASKKNYIVAQVDGSGSGGRGWFFQHQVYHRLGALESNDQIEVIRYLRDSLHFVEPKKIGIWGWSYGGFLTALIMNSYDTNEVFKCGASIAPVTNWRFYDSAYTERYMGIPNVTGNYKGYEENDISRSILESDGTKMFYLVHGTADDNVHIQHSMLLAKALVEKKILFRQQIYADEPHSLSGVRMHVHKSLEIFLEDCFRKQMPPELGTGLNKGGQIEE